jgi:hypothetical protein
MNQRRAASAPACDCHASLAVSRARSANSTQVPADQAQPVRRYPGAPSLRGGVGCQADPWSERDRPVDQDAQKGPRAPGLHEPLFRH